MIQEKALFQGVGHREYMRYKMSDLTPHQLSDFVGNAFLWPHASAWKAIQPGPSFHHCVFLFCRETDLHITKVLCACFPGWIHDGCGHVESAGFLVMMTWLAGEELLCDFTHSAAVEWVISNYCFVQIHAVAETDSLACSGSIR